MTLAALLVVLAVAAPPPGARVVRIGASGISQTFEVDLTPLSQHEGPPLDSQTMDRLRAIGALRASGELPRARDGVMALLAQQPHHPWVLGELARIEQARGDWAAVVRLGQTERASQHDSLLLGRELSQALEHLRRPRESAQVALECWVARPAEAEWAFSTIARLGPSDSRGVRDVLRRGAAARPDRVDLQNGAARLDWKLGDGPTALKALLAADRPGLTPPLRWRFADELLRSASERDSLGAVDALASMAADARFDPSYRMLAARRVLDVHQARGTERVGAPLVYQALKDLPPPRWTPELLIDVARGLRQAGQTTAARALLDTPTLGGNAHPGLTLERALNDLRDGPPASCLGSLGGIAGESPEAAFRYAEALFFSGLADSALTVYKHVSEDPEGAFTGAALERMFLIEDAQPRGSLPTVGRLMYLDWRGDSRATLALADSLYRTLPHGALWAQVALLLSARLDAAGQFEAALAPALQVADQLPDDRLAPVARQRAGDLYLYRLKKEPEALAQYEACLIRYPKAWNSAEVRRRLESLRKRRL